MEVKAPSEMGTEATPGAGPSGARCGWEELKQHLTTDLQEPEWTVPWATINLLA